MKRPIFFSFFILPFMALVDTASASCQGYGIVGRDNGYSWDVFNAPSGNVVVKLPSADADKLDKVRVSFGDSRDIKHAKTAYEKKQPIDANFTVQREPGQFVFLSQWWQGTLPDGHGEIC